MQKLLEKLPKIKIIPNFLKHLPETPGVYIYFHDQNVIYIGKAINLKRRISSYFDLDLEPKTRKMINEANNISYIKVNSELSALLLEAKLIRSCMPHYNIAAKDDKHPLYIQITKDEFPRIITVRKNDAQKSPAIAVYGPFPASNSVRTVLRLLRRIFPYSDHKIGKRACLYSHIGLCKPCPSIITTLSDPALKAAETKKYKSNIRNIKMILDGRAKLAKTLSDQMQTAAKVENYEVAITLRNQMSQLAYITKREMPTEHYLENPNLYEDVRQKEVLDLSTLLKNNGIEIDNLNRIECFDIAHLGGTNATASMVTFIEGEPDKKYYRHFKIKRARGGDDYGSMTEVGKRRERHFDDWGKPDLIIVDGGMGQVKAFTQKKIQVPVVGVAKHPDRIIIGSKKIKLIGPALSLVSRMRDEAHRFARRYHHTLISRSIKNANTT